MKRIVLSTTSSCLETLDIRHKVEFIRFKVYVNNVDFVDGKNINAERLSQIMIDSPAAPSSTSPASVDEVLAKFKELENRGYTDVYVVAISSAISQSVENILRAKAIYTGNLNIFVYDSKAASIMEGALAFEADSMLQAGKSFNEITQRLDQIRQNSYTYITVSRLDYLIANKKISSPAGFFANLLDIKPVIELTQAGELVPIKKIRKIEKSLEYITDEFLKLRSQGAFVYMLACGDENLNRYFANLLAQSYNMGNIPILQTSTITLANHGPNMVGLGAFSGELPQITKHL